MKIQQQKQNKYIQEIYIYIYSTKYIYSSHNYVCLFYLFILWLFVFDQESVRGCPYELFESFCSASNNLFICEALVWRDINFFSFSYLFYSMKGNDAANTSKVSLRLQPERPEQSLAGDDWHPADGGDERAGPAVVVEARMHPRRCWQVFFYFSFLNSRKPKRGVRLSIMTHLSEKRFIAVEDQEWFDKTISTLVKKELGDNYERMIRETQFFVDFLRQVYTIHYSIIVFIYYTFLFNVHI